MKGKSKGTTVQSTSRLNSWLFELRLLTWLSEPCKLHHIWGRISLLYCLATCHWAQQERTSNCHTELEDSFQKCRPWTS